MQILALNPASQTVAPATPASYTVTVTNPTSSADTFNLAVLGVAAGWVNLPSSVGVGANSRQCDPDSDVGCVRDAGRPRLHGDRQRFGRRRGGGAGRSCPGGFAAHGRSGAHGIVATLTPATATAGQGTSAVYTVQLTNTGTADDTFTLTAAGLPAGVAAAFSQTTIDVPPGVSNFRDVTLTLTPQIGTAAGDIPFTVTATLTAMPAIASTAAGTLTVLPGGVGVSITPTSGGPATSYQLTVTNTGRVIPSTCRWAAQPGSSPGWPPSR